jgi:hypothetical protein
MQKQADGSSYERSADADVLQVFANLELHFLRHLTGIPSPNDLGDQSGNLVPMTHQYVLDRLQQPGVELGLQSTIVPQTAAERDERLRELAPDQ